MIKKLFVLAVLSANALYAQRYERLIETRTISNHEIVGAEHDAASNSLFVLSNVSNQNGNGILAKVNALNGDTIWSKFVAPTVQQENFKGLYKSTNALFAYGLRTFASAQYAFIAKLDFNGDTIWTKHYKTLATTSCTNPHITINGLLELSNGDLVMVGRNNACDRAVLLKTNSLGVVSLIKEYDQWLQNIYSPLWEFYGIESDGTNYFVSARYGKAQQNWDYYKGIWKLDLNGDLVTSFNSQFAQNSEIFGFKRDASGNFYLLGQHNPITQDVGILEKFNASGVSQWTFNPSGVTIQWSGITDIEFDAGGDALVSGFFQKQNQSVDQFASRINSSTGAEVWIKQYGYGDNGYGREMVKLGTNFLMVSDENFGWSAGNTYGVFENNPPHSHHPVIQVFNSNGEVGRFKKTPGEESKKGKNKFFAYASFSFNNSNWSNVSLVPITLASPTGGTSSFQVWNNNFSYAIYSAQTGNQNDNGVGTFYFTASDKNGDTRISDTLEVLTSPSFNALDIYGSPAVIACSGDSLLLAPDIQNLGSTLKWFYTGVSGSQTAVKIGTGLNVYAKNKGYYFLREILSNGDSASTNQKLLNIETDQVNISSSTYPQSFWVSGEVSDSTNRKTPSPFNWGLNKNIHHWIAPLGRYRKFNVQQYYYSVADLQSRGLSANSAIDQIAFEVAESFTSSSSLRDFKISARWVNAMPSSWTTLNSNDVVYDNYWQNVNSTGGEYSFDISNLTWNGTSALVIQMSYEVDNYSIATDQNPLFKLSESTINVSRILQSNSNITLIGSTGIGNKFSKFRPLTKFKMSLPTKLDTIVGCSNTISLQVNNSGYQALSWGSGATASSLSVTTPGQYSVVMMDGNFCFSYDTVQVIFNPNANQIVASADTVVQGASITLTAQPAYLNVWSSGGTGNTVSVSTTGQYKLTSINEDGCNAIDSVSVVVLELPKIYKGARPLYSGQAIPNYTYMGAIGSSHIYYSNSSYPFNQVKSVASQLGGRFWYPKNAVENSLINSLYKSKISCCGARWIGIQRASLTDPWVDVYSNAVTYTNWDVNADPNRLFGIIEFGWDGFWTGSANGSNDSREFFIEFQDYSSLANPIESACDSLLLWTEEGYDSYVWSVDNVVISGHTGNEIWASANGNYTVAGMRNNVTHSGTSNVQLTLNQTPAASIINASGTVDLTGSNTIKLKAIPPAGASVEWFRGGVSLGTADSILTTTIGWHTLAVTANGCTSRDSVEISAPFFVATTGDNQTGDGSLSNPFATIQHAVNTASAGAKIYVLPGTYNENVLVTKAIKILSNYDRLGDTTAMFTTIINGGGAGRVVDFHNFTGASKTVLSGFTIKNGFNSNNPGSGIFMQDVFGEGVVLSNLLVTENVRQFPHEGISFAQWGGRSELFNVRFVNNGSPALGDEYRDVVIRFTGVSNWDRVKYVGNASQYDAISIMEGSELNIVNSMFTNSEPQNGDCGLFGIHGSSSKLTLNHVTAWNNILNNHNNQYFIRNHSTTNSEVKVLNSVIDAGSNRIIEIQQNNTYYVFNSVLNGRIIGGTGTLDSSRVKRSIGYVTGSGALSPYSEAIGHARPVTIGATSHPTPSTDLVGLSRPNPVGSYPDAGALESSLDQGIFGIDVSQCGYDITLRVLNSLNYSVSWTGPNAFTSYDTSLTVQEEGTYIVTVISLDRADTTTQSVQLINPLRASIVTKDVCLAAGTNSGYIDIRNVQGGTPFTGINVPTQKWGLSKNGIYVAGPNWDIWGSTWYWNGNLQAGEYVLEISDASCTVSYPFTLNSKSQRSVFVGGANGSNTNGGSLNSPYGSLQHAINQACDRDTIFILDGILTEDSIIVNKEVIITSLYSRDGDTMHIKNAVVDANFMEAAFYVNIQSSNWNQPSDTAFTKFVGFTVTNGLKYAGQGGGVNVTKGNVVFRNMIFLENEGSNGGAIQVNQDAGTIVVDQCLFKQNRAIHGSAFYARGGYFNIKRSTFIRNVASQQSTVYFDNWCCGQGGFINDSKFFFNEANSYAVGEWKNWIDGQPRTISKNITAIGNVSNSGPLFRVYSQGNGSEVVLNNWLVAKNEWPIGQSMFEFNWLTVQLNHATILHNKGGSIFNLYEEAQLYATNSIIDHGSAVLNVANSQSPSTSKTYFRNVAWNAVVPSLGTHSHVGNISLSGIYFVDTVGNDFRLAKTASVIGAGLASFSIGNKTINAPGADLFSNARPLPVGSSPDLGAIESVYGSPQVGINLSVVHPTICDSTSGSVTSQLINALGNYAVTWTNGLGDTVGAQPNLTDLSSGDYIVEYFDAATNFTYSDTASVRIPDELSVVFIFDTATCSDDLVQLSLNISGGTPFASTGYNVSVVLDSSVSNSQGFASSVSGTSINLNVKTGYYTVIIEDAAGCRKVSSVEVPFSALSPSVEIVSKTGSFDYLGTPLKLYTIRSTGSSLVWSGGSTADTLIVQAQQLITATVTKDGCSSVDSQLVSLPKFVAKTGSDQNPGTLQLPYLTIQHAINQSNAGQKIYVLPGVYAEKVLVDRPIVLQSNYDRLGDTSALHTTIIEPGTVGQITSALNQNIQASGGFNIIEQGSGRVEVSGFTIRNYVANYSGDWDKSSQFNIYNSDNVLVENLKLSGATQGQGQGCCNAAVVFEVQYSDNVEFDNVRIANNGTSSQNGHRLAYVNSASISIRNSRITNNYQDRGIHMESSYFLLENSLYSSNVVGDEGAFILGQNNNTLVWNYATARTTTSNGSFPKMINVLGSNNKVAFLNSVLRQDLGPVVYNSGTSNSLEVKSSVAGLNLLGGAPSGIVVTIDSLSTVNTAPQILPNARLMPNSPAIGKGKLVQNAFGRSFLMPAKDLAGVLRPSPFGSMPDAGAYESNLAIGELDLSITTCGYNASVVVLNSQNYQVMWTGPAGFTSTSLNPVLPLKGNYQLTLIAIDRQDTIVRNVPLNNPLEFTVTSVRDVCEGIGTNSGSITWGNITGGVNNNDPNQGWKKKSSILNPNGSQFDGEWWIDNSNWTTTRSGMPSGTFIIKVIDGSGCAVYDTVVIGSQPSNTYFISTTGSDSALGTASNPLKTISEALTRACDGDTIILEDGRHYENVIMGNNAPRLTIASRYLLDGDTNHIRNAIVDGMDVNPVFNISDLNNQGTTDTLRLLGFTVTNGLANSGWNGGGGISARWSNVSLVKIRAVENRSGQNGGGIGIWECDLKLKDVLIKDNFATNDGGGLHLQYINNDLLNTNVRIIGNQSSNGGGLYYSHGLGNTGQVYELDGFEVVNNFATNQGGGIFFGCWSGEADVQLSNSKVIGNRATNQSGGIVVQSNNADFFFVNDIIAKNESGYAGAMSINNSKAHFVHSTVYSNKHILGSTSSILNLAVHVENQSSLKMYNSILGGQGTGGKNVYIQDNNSNFEIVSGQLGGGVSNTVQAPNASQIIYLSSSPNYTNQQVFLKDPNGGDYSLAKVSQAIGRGLTSFTNGPVVPLVDIYGNARPNVFGSDPDLGAIESSDTAASFGVAFVVSDNNACNPSIGQITAYPQNGSGAYSYSWTSLNGGIISNPTGSGAAHTIANLFTGQYRVVVTDVVTNASFVDTATVRGDSPLTLNRTVSNEGCQGTNTGEITIDVAGGSGFYTYTWLLPNGGGTLNTKNISNLAPGIYSVTVTDNKGCSISSTDTVGTDFAQPSLTITSQILKPGGTSVTGGNDVRMCIGDQVVFNAGSGFDYYEWNKSDGLNTEYSQTVSSYVSETYSVYVEDTNGCSTTGTAKIFVVYEPNVYASNVNRTMGQQFQQVTSYVRGDTTTQSNFVNSEVSPYDAQGTSLKKSQFVISASELQGAGLTENTTINSLAFDVVNPSGTAFQAYKIKLAHTAAQQLGAWQSPAAQQEVFAIPVYAPVQGWNTHNFTSSFAWNGVDNLLVEVCYTPIGNAMSSASVRVNQVATANTLTNFSYSANSCSDPVQSMGSSPWRPTVRFGIDKVEVLDTIRVCDFTTLNTTDDYDTYTWYVNGVASPTAALALNLTSPASVVLAATDAASSCVMYSDTFYVALDTTPTVLATSNIVGALCAGDSVVLSTPSVGLASYLWSNGDTSMTSTVFESGSYILEARSANGCAGTDTVVVNVNTPPTVVVKLNGKTLTATDGSLASKVNTCVQSVLLPFGENFEDSLYVWTQATNDQLDWTFNSGATNTQFSGPNGDFTTSDSSGNYYYLDRAGSNSDDNKEAHLISPCVQMIGSSRPYLTFGYHMYNGLYNAANPSSDNMGTLRIEAQTTDDAANYWVPLWTKTGHQGIGWKSDTVDLTQFAGQTIRLRIVGKAGVGGPRSEMAIDGISIIDTANSFANTSGRISADIICEGDLLIAQTISNGSTQFNYVWNTGDTTSALKVDSTGYYYVSVMDENGCSIMTDSVWIEVSPIPDNALVVTGDLSNCYNETVAVTVQAPMNYSKYSWFSNDSTLVPSGTTTTLVSMQGLAIGNYALGVRIFDSIGCAAISDTVVVNRHIQPLIQDSVVATQCFGDSTGAIVVSPTTGPLTWSWSNGDTTSNPTGLLSGTYQVIFTDEFGCSDTASVFVPQPTELTALATVQDVQCNDETNGSLTLNVSGATTPYWLDWNTTGVDSSLTRVTLALDMRSAGASVSPFVSIVGIASNIQMNSPLNDGIYYVTVERQPNTILYYRFYNGSSPELVPLACGINPPSLTTLHRNLLVGFNDTTLNRVCFASCVDCDGQVIGARSEVLVGGSTTISSQGSGVITLTIFDANGCSVTINDTIVQPDAINIQLDTIVDVSCPQAGDGAIQLTTIGGIMPYAFDWSNGDTIEDLLTVNEGTYTITVTDLNGCVDTASYEIMAPMPYNFEEICMMTVDSLTGKNQVVWNKTPGQRTMEYQIFKETNVAGQYAQIGTVPYLNMSVFTDVNSVPQQQPDRYKIIAVDSCGNSSDTSDLHRTIHLQSNFGSGGEVNLSWTDYEGRSVQTYDIFRWVSAGNLVQIGSVSGATTTFSDLNPPVAPNVYYNVRAVFAGGACAPAAGKTSSYESARSNILDQTGIGMPDLPWKGLARMFPNPTNSMVRIEVPESGFVVRVTNMLGQLIHETSVQESSVVLDLGHVAAGMYQVELYRDGQVMSIDKLHVVH